MAVKANPKGEVNVPPTRKWSPKHPWGLPCLVDECREEHAPMACALFKDKSPEDRLAIVRKRELCILCFRHLDTKQRWSLGKVDNCGVKGCARAHNALMHYVLQNKEVMMVSALPGIGREAEPVLRCRQVVAAENGGQCFRLNVLYDWGASMSMVSREAIDMMGLSPSKQAKRVVKGLGGATTMSRGTCTVSLVARNGDLRAVMAWEVGAIASLPGSQPPEDVDEQFPRLRYLSEPNCLSQKGGPIHVLIGMDHAHLMPEHVAESTEFNSQLRLMKSCLASNISWSEKERRAFLGVTRWWPMKDARQLPEQGRGGKSAGGWRRRRGRRP
jgi:hypothetical protein